MANIYVRSTDGNDADNGSTWALAKATLSGAFAIVAAGDTIWVSQVHAETPAGNQTYSCIGTRAAPIKVICANDGAAPPTADATTGGVTTTTASNISFSSSIPGSTYIYGLIFSIGSGANTATFSILGTAAEQIYENCDFIIAATGAAAGISFNTTAGGFFIAWLNCRIKFGATSQTLSIGGNGTIDFHWQGGSIISGSASPSSTRGIFDAGSDGPANVLVEDVDLSNLNAAVHIHNGSTSNNGPSSFVIRNCKLPSAWSGSLVRQTIVGIHRYTMHNCSAGSQNYKLWIECAEGTIRDETTIVRLPGATDGVTPISWKMTSVANVSYPGIYLASDEILFFNSSTAVVQTLQIHILHDSATSLTNADIWVEVSYLGSAATPLGTFITSAPADPLATATNNATSVVAWNTSGMANPNKQRLVAILSPGMVGFISVRVCLAKASKTVYVCPKMEII